MENKNNVKYWSMEPEKVLELLNLKEYGLTSINAEARLLKYGENSIKKKKKTSDLMLLFSQFKNFIILILLIATLISAVTGELIDAVIILTIVLGSVILSFFQEYSASNAIEQLRAKVSSKTVVLRDKKTVEIPSTKIVPGDVIKLSAGSLIPADGLILESLNFFVDQSVLTGESLPSLKKPSKVDEDANVADRINFVYMGTNVYNGSATVLVVETGSNTEFGKIANKLNLRLPATEFEMGIRQFGYLLSKIMLILTLTVFAINIILEKPAIDSLLFSVALAVGITPQLLPAIISITLSKGARIMAKDGVIVKRLNAIESFGSMDILCTDKTGTLTEGTIRLDGATNFEGKPSKDVFKLAYINAKLQIGMFNSLDKAILDSRYIDISDIKKRGELPFDFIRERMGVIIQDGYECNLIVKGAFNSVLEICDTFYNNGVKNPINDKVLAKIMKNYRNYSNQGIRVLGVAKKPVLLKDKYKLEDENNMTFMGFLLLYDHPKDGVKEAIVDLKNKGVSLKIITGDNKLVAIHTANAVGHKVTGVLTGAELMKLSDNALLHKIETTNIFAEVNPNQKERIILAFKKRGHVVGYMGDGINDVLALHVSDVSISVDNAVDAAKESADFVLMENNLNVLSSGIELGRRTFSNTLKYILVTTSANFGNMFSMAGASLFLPFLPLLPKQILMINFLTDFPAINITRDNVDKNILEKYRRWDIGFIKKFMITFGLISSIFDYITFATLFLGFKIHHGVFQSSWFIFSVLTELVALLIMRTQKPFYKSKPAPILIYSALIVGILTLAIPYINPINTLLNIEQIRLSIILLLFGIIIMYMIVTEIVKYYFYKNR